VATEEMLSGYVSIANGAAQRELLRKSGRPPACGQSTPTE